MASKFYFRLNEGCGTHSGNDGKIYQGGDVVPSETNLAKIFVHKFTRVSAAAYTDSLPEVVTAESDDEEVDPVDDAPVNPLGVDVTDMFSDAPPLELVILKKGGQYYIADKSSPSTALNPTKITSKTGVLNFLAAYK